MSTPMKKQILLCICWLPFWVGAQTLTEGTIGAFGTDVTQLTGTAGEPGVFPVEENTGLYAGLIEILASLSEDMPVNNEEIGPVADAKIYTGKSFVVVETKEPCFLSIVNLAGNVLLHKKIDGTCRHTLETGIYVLNLQNGNRRSIYKISVP